MYEARKVANFVLARFDAVRFEITNLRLNKLLYFMHGWALVEEPGGLVRNHFEAWKLGPVLPSLYAEFKQYGDKPIQGPAEFLNYSNGQREPVPISDIEARHQVLIERVFQHYVPYSTSQLVAMSHETEGAWTAALRKAGGAPLNVRIPNHLIREHFLLISGPGRRH